MKQGDTYRCVKHGACYRVVCVGLMRFGEGYTKSVTLQDVAQPAFYYTYSYLEFQQRFYES